jgi:hypothetical protein
VFVDPPTKKQRMSAGAPSTLPTVSPAKTKSAPKPTATPAAPKPTATPVPAGEEDWPLMPDTMNKKYGLFKSATREYLMRTIRNIIKERNQLYVAGDTKRWSKLGKVQEALQVATTLRPTRAANRARKSGEESDADDDDDGDEGGDAGGGGGDTESTAKSTPEEVEDE